MADAIAKGQSSSQNPLYRKFKEVQVEQRTPEWFSARSGKITGSIYHSLIKKTSTGKPSLENETKMNAIVQEHLAGTNSFAPPLETGTEAEKWAFRAFQKLKPELHMYEAGFVESLEFEGVGVSPDGYINDDGLIEIKCLGTNRQTRIIQSGEIPDEYIDQMAIQLFVTGRKYCYFVMFDPYIENHNIWFEKYELTPEKEAEVYENLKKLSRERMARIWVAHKLRDDWAWHQIANKRMSPDYHEICKEARENFIINDLSGMYVQNRDGLSLEAQEAPNIISTTRAEAYMNYYRYRMEANSDNEDKATSKAIEDEYASLLALLEAK